MIAGEVGADARLGEGLMVSNPAEITVKIEIKQDHEADTYSVLHDLGGDLARNHEGLRFNVDAVDHGTLPRFELKAKRLVDERRLG